VNDQPTEGPGGLQAALPRELYVDPDSWRRERDAVLYAEWFCVGRLADLGLATPGRVAVVDVVGESVLVTSDDAGALHAAYNVCRHRGSQLFPLEPGTGTVCEAAGAIRCPYHSWTYALDGRLLRAPHTELAEQERAQFSLHPVAVETREGFVFVHLTPDAAGPLDDSVSAQLGRLANYRMGELVTGQVLTYEVAANYKVVAENYNECYHCGPVHPELTRLVPSFGAGGTGIDWEGGVPHREGAWTFTMSGTTDRAPLPGLDEGERTRHKGELVHPNLMISCSADHVATFVLLPQDVDRTRIECRLLFHPDAVADPAFDPTDAGDFWDLVNRQDWAICESVQRGMSSRAYRHGWFAEMEDDSADIRRWLLPRLGQPVVEVRGAPAPSLETPAPEHGGNRGDA
jgi:glycine betaine catabolism A